MYVQTNTLLLVDVFENFKNMCIEIYKLDPANFFSAFGLAWQAALKKTKVKLDLLTDINMLLMVEKGIIYVNNLYGWAMSQKLPVNNFEWIKAEGFFLEVDHHCLEKLAL